MSRARTGPERRASRRFDLHQMALIRIKDNQGIHEISGITQNASKGGALVLADSEIAKGSRVELHLTLQRNASPIFRLYCRGDVVRVERQNVSGKIPIAIACIEKFDFMHLNVG
jgi:PilZ domain